MTTRDTALAHQIGRAADLREENDLQPPRFATVATANVNQASNLPALTFRHIAGNAPLVTPKRTRRKPTMADDRPASTGLVDDVAAVVEAVPAAPKPKRVRTGCLTCRERHLKCDEGLPNCLNCKKSGKTCKRGIKLNFHFIDVRDPAILPKTADWSGTLLPIQQGVDEVRLRNDGGGGEK